MLCPLPPVVFVAEKPCLTSMLRLLGVICLRLTIIELFPIGAWPPLVKVSTNVTWSEPWGENRDVDLDAQKQGITLRAEAALEFLSY